VTLAFVVPWGQAAVAALVVGLGFAWLAGRWLTSQLGGLTGDTYGAIETLTETVVLLVFWVTSWIPGGLHILWR
jgi:adenosylcobinamide-GDP ribazoletransferase